jgi:hypothetical protein
VDEITIAECNAYMQYISAGLEEDEVAGPDCISPHGTPGTELFTGVAG